VARDTGSHLFVHDSGGGNINYPQSTLQGVVLCKGAFAGAGTAQDKFFHDLS
jgi:hypothetical protein